MNHYGASLRVAHLGRSYVTTFGGVSGILIYLPHKINFLSLWGNRIRCLSAHPNLIDIHAAQTLSNILKEPVRSESPRNRDLQTPERPTARSPTGPRLPSRPHRHPRRTPNTPQRVVPQVIEGAPIQDPQTAESETRSGSPSMRGSPRTHQAIGARSE